MTNTITADKVGRVAPRAPQATELPAPSERPHDGARGATRPTLDQEPTCPADLSVGFAALIAAFQLALPNRLMLETEIHRLTGTRASVFAALGWLQKQPSGRYGTQFFPAGALLDALSGVSHNPPNSEGAGTVMAESEIPPLAGATPVPVAPALSKCEGRGERSEWRGEKGEVRRELADMISVLREVSDQTRKSLIEIGAAQELEHSWENFNEVRQATAHLRRLASDLYNQLSEYETRLGFVEMEILSRRRKQPQLKHA